MSRNEAENTKEKKKRKKEEKKSVKKKEKRKFTKKKKKAIKERLLSKLGEKKTGLSQFLISLILFSFYTVFASGGIYLRISRSTFSMKNFLIISAGATILSILPVVIWRFRITFIVSFALAVALGLTSGTMTSSASGTSINDLYYLEIIFVVFALFFGVRIYIKLPELKVKIKMKDGKIKAKVKAGNVKAKFKKH